MKYEGRVWKFGDHVDTDVIIPARFLNVSDKDELAKHCFEDVRPEFVKEVAQGDILLAGVNFGCGSSREHAPLAIKSAGIGVVVARSFARIFYRSAFNIGLPILECEEAFDAFSDGEQISVDLRTGEIGSKVEGVRVFAKPIPDFMSRIIEAGGLVPYIKAKGTF
ncbi:MAG: 3-isopropylmalate dehydratase small subunit [Deltaproteobacteria bacterium]|nr:3-isopropylmalate dehydratase small subunit [Deltaproteobacteria bacterium]MBW2015478.1 3-isopropylmalate dehydratase small subunit [Deltaproteobacteria bacterium]MBW2128427.1 3-isopropylmalate dehydratase small subunit [Deltaproteobacteria bacterium]MBW2303898.1 3-isopropylmalate dehydratase small subunit [Deltaproteobacteria bacterium]